MAARTVISFHIGGDVNDEQVPGNIYCLLLARCHFGIFTLATLFYPLLDRSEHVAKSDPPP